jgi:iron complex outermembrane receptor protein
MIKKIISEVSLGRIGIMTGAVFIALSTPAQDTNVPTVMKPTVVTGSYIPTAETVGPAPVQTLSSEAIDQGGQADPLLTLKKLVPSFTGGANYLGNANNNVILGAGFQGFTGQSYAALRNLPTLILIDGQRVVTTALSGGQAVDLNSIPLAMVERIEVLKDGASAIYGSDAIGGVINIITKKNFNGFEIGGRLGFPTTDPVDHGLQSQAYLLAGATTDKARFTAGAQIFEQNALLTKDRLIGSQSIEQLAAQNVVPPAYFSPSYPGKVQNGSAAYILASSPFAAGGPGYNPNLRTPPVFPGFSSNSIAAYNAFAISHGYVDPTGNGLGPYIPFAITPAGQQLTSIGLGPASAWPALNTTQFGTTSILDQERRQFWANMEYDLYEDKLTVYSRFQYSDNKAHGELAPSPVVSLNLYNITVPANNPYNPFGIDLGAPPASTSPRVRSRFVDTGNRQFDTFSDFYQWVGGLKGNITPDYSYDVSFDYGQDRSEQQTRNAINGAALNQALIPIGQVDAQGRPLSQLLDAAGNNLPVYNIFGSSLTPGSGLNAPETLDQIRSTLFTWGQSELYSAQGVFNARPIDLPAGKLNVAFGAQYINEQLSLQVDGLTKQGLVPGLNAAQAFPGGKRETTAGFIEVNIPIFGKEQDIPGLYDLEISAAGRYQTFDPGGNKGVPKIAVRWQPIDEQLTLRASYGQGFIAPPIWQLFGPDFVNNPSVTIQGQPGQVNTQTRANPNLEPSNAEQFGAGFVFSPKFIKGLTVGADFYHVTEDHLAVADAQSAANSLNALGSASPYAPGFTYFNDAGDIVHLTSTAPNQVTVDNWNNLIIPWSPAAALRTEGLDLSLNYVLPIDQRYGKITFGAVANVIINYEYQTSPSRPYFDYVGTFTPIQGLIPDYNITATLTYEYRGWTAVGSMHYLPEMTDPGGLFPEYNLGEQGFTINNPTQPYKIPSYVTFDIQLSYEFGKGKVEGRKWYDGSKFTVGVLNIGDETPRLIPDAVEDNTDKNNYDVLGRFVYFEVSKKF